MEPKLLYEFGKFRCDPREHVLSCEGTPVALAPKSFEILVVLIESHGRLMTKDELMQQVWRDSHVEEANLTVNISSLRKALGETGGGQRYIETVPKLGYRFVAPVKVRPELGTQVAPAPSSAPVSQVLPPSAISATARRIRIWRRWWLIAPALPLVAVVLATITIGRAPKLTAKDTVVLADFANSTGDQVFDGALRQGLSSQLEQSPYLHLLSDERIAQTLLLMAQPKNARLTHELAHDVCQRTASAAVLDPAIAQVGTQYLLTLKAINCSNGESLSSASATAANKNQVLEALGVVASKIRNQLGESLASVQKYQAPAENVTTPSLEALKAYSLGYQAMIVQSDYEAAILFLQRAISLDPNFAMAHARLATSYSNINETVRAAESARRAYELRERASEREKFYISAHYELFVTGDLEAARKVYEMSAQTYGDAPFNNLGLIYSELGDLDKALEAYRNVLKVSAGTGNRYGNLVSGYLQLNRLEEAKAAAREARAHNIDSPEIHLNLYWIAFLQHDAAGMERERAAMRGKAGYEDQMLNHEADTALYAGHLAQARQLTQAAIQAAEKADEKEAVALYHAQAAVREALVENPDAAKQEARAALMLSSARDVAGLSAIALEMAGDSVPAMQLVNNLAKRFPEDTIVESTYLPAARAASSSSAVGFSLPRRKFAAGPYELGGNLENVTFVLYPVYLRAGAYLAARDGPAAADEFLKIIDHPGVVRSEPIGALAYLGLGRAYVLLGNHAKARSAYDEFLNLWKTADPDIALLKKARAEYANLH